MKRWIRSLFERQQRALKTPWAMLEIDGFETDGRVRVGFDFNPAFVEKVKALGFQAETDEDTVQLFFVASALRPTQLVGDAAVQSDAHPQLSGPQNVLVQ